MTTILFFVIYNPALKMTEKYIDVFNDIDEKHIITANDFILNAGLPFDLDSMYHICYYAKSRSGKSCHIAHLLMHHFLHTIRPENVYIFSPSFRTD